MPQLARQLLAVCTTYLYFPWNGIKQLPISYTLISFYMKKKEKKKKKFNIPQTGKYFLGRFGWYHR